MEAARRIVIVGGGPAGVGAAIAAKQQDKAAQVTLLSDEPCEPYEKPPLSKAVLLGKVAPEDAPIAGPGGLSAHGIVFRPDARVHRIDRAARSIVTEGGEAIPYDSLVLATGAMNRVLPTFPPGDGIHYLRTEAEARMLKADLARSKSLILIGGGVIGLEVAASAAELGIKATVIEIAPRILARLCDADTSALDSGTPSRTRRRYPHRCPGRRRAAQREQRLHCRDQRRRHSERGYHCGGCRRIAGRSAGERRRPRGQGRHHRRRPRPHIRPRDFRGRRLHALYRAARPGAPGELASRPGARHGGGAQCGRRRRRLQHRAIILVGAIRHVYPRRRLAGGTAERARAAHDRRRMPCCCSNWTALTSPMPSASMPSAISPWRAG